MPAIVPPARPVGPLGPGENWAHGHRDAVWRDQLTPPERAELGRGAGGSRSRARTSSSSAGGSSGSPPRPHATRPGLGSVLLIEAGRLGSGATGGAAGLLTPEIHEWSDPEPFVDLARASLELWAELERTWPGGVGLIDSTGSGSSRTRTASPRTSAFGGVAGARPGRRPRPRPGAPDGRRADPAAGTGQPAAFAGPAGRRPARGRHRHRGHLGHRYRRPHHLGDHHRRRHPPRRGGLRHRAAAGAGRPARSTSRPAGSKATCWSPSRHPVRLPARWRRSPPSSTTAGCWSAARSTSATRAPVVPRSHRLHPGRACTPRCPPCRGCAPTTSGAVSGPGTRTACRSSTGCSGLDNAWLTSGHYRTGILMAPITAQAICPLDRRDEPPAEAAAWSSARFAGRGLTGR